MYLSSGVVNYDTYYINDQKFFDQDQYKCTQKYPKKFTDNIKKIISLRSVITFYTKSLLELKYKSGMYTISEF